MKLDFQRQFEEYLISQESLEPRKVGSYGVTYLSRPCLLGVYRLYTEKHPLQVEKLKLFAVGDALHLGIQEAVKRFSDLTTPIFEGRYSVKDAEGFEIVGKPDVVAYLKLNLVDSPIQCLHPVVVEIKTVNPWCFRMVKRNGVLEHHATQLQGYLHLVGSQNGFIVYIKQTDGSSLEYRFARDVEAWNTLLNRAKTLHEALLSKKTPQPNPCWFCSYCEFKGDCKHVLRKKPKA